MEPALVNRAASLALAAIVGSRRRVLAAVLSGVALVVAVALMISRGDVAQSGTIGRTQASPEVPTSTSYVHGAIASTDADTDAVRSPAPTAVAGGPGTAGRAPPRPVPVRRDRGRETRTGELAIIVKPWAMIWLNGKPSGQTPFRGPVPAGRYRVRLVNDDIARSETATVTVEPGQTATVERSW